MLTTEKVWWKRTGWVAIENSSGDMVKYGGSHNGLDFKFSGEKYGDISTNFHVGILGLSLETIKELTVWRPWNAVLNPRRIQVFAGYETDSLDNPIFDGFIFNAMPTKPPEMWLEIDCKTFLKDTSPIMPFSVTDTGFNILNTIGHLFSNGNGVAWARISADEEEPPELKNEMTFHFEGSPIQMMTKFAEQTDGIVYHENGMMFWIRKEVWNDARWITSSASKINLANGMIDIPKIDYKGAIIKRRLNDDIPLMKWVNLESKMVPSANGAYFVKMKRHTGHFRGNDWFTEIETIRKPNSGSVSVQREDGSWYDGGAE